MSKLSHVEPSNPNSLFIGISLVLSIGFIFGVLFFASLCYKSTVCSTMNQRQITPMPKAMKDLKQYEYVQLNSLKWVNKDKGIVQVPLKLAMELVVKDYE